jgi:hypothetical protein
MRFRAFARSFCSFVQASATGPVTTLLVRQSADLGCLGGDNTKVSWFVHVVITLHVQQTLSRRVRAADKRSR